MSDTNEECLTWLRGMRDVMRPHIKLKYKGLVDFVLCHGQHFENVKPWDKEAGRKKACFTNAGNLAIVHKGLTYVEGYAYKDGMFPMEHAWVIDEDGNVLDSTWIDAGDWYFGVPFDRDYLVWIWGRSSYSGVIDKPDLEFPLLTGKHEYRNGVVNLKGGR